MRRSSFRTGVDPWAIGSGVAAVVILAPLLALLLAALRGSEGLWQHVAVYVLPPAIRDTMTLLVGVGLLAAGLGTGTAWLVTACDFPGRRAFDWALLLPLAVPTYIIAYAYLDLLHPVGPVQTAIRALLGIDSPRDFRLPDIRSMTGCIGLLGFVLYPYVYLSTRAMFLMQSGSLIDVARTLGVSRRQVFLRVALPLARPAIAVGVSLVLLEALNDIGASEFLGVRTLTVSIYATWVTGSDLPGAAQIALAMLVVVLALVLVERYARRQRRYANDAQHPRPLIPHRLHGWRAGAAIAVCAVPVAIGFVIPAIYLVGETVERVRLAGVSEALLSETMATVLFSVAGTIVTLVVGVVVAYAGRLRPGFVAATVARVAGLGYAVPGTVLAIGLLPVVTGVEALVDAGARATLGASTGLFLLGSGAAVVYAYLVRFLALASGGVETGLARVPVSLDDAARTLGAGGGSRFWRLHVPLLRPVLATAALLVFVDCMKELPATLLLRPLGIETLSTHLYGEAIRGTYEDAAAAALCIVLAGILPVLVLARVSRTDGAIRL